MEYLVRDVWNVENNKRALIKGGEVINNNASYLRKELESFKLSTIKISEKINGVSDIWGDSNYASLQVQISELAKTSRMVIESGEKVCSSTDKFFAISTEEV